MPSVECREQGVRVQRKKKKRKPILPSQVVLLPFALCHEANEILSQVVKKHVTKILIIQCVVCRDKDSSVN